MSQYEKMLARVTSKKIPCDITPQELHTFLSKFGFREQGTNGDHRTYKYDKYPYLITIPVASKTVKFAYIKQIREAIERIKEDGEKNYGNN